MIETWLHVHSCCTGSAVEIDIGRSSCTDTSSLSSPLGFERAAFRARRQGFPHTRRGDCAWSRFRAKAPLYAWVPETRRPVQSRRQPQRLGRYLTNGKRSYILKSSVANEKRNQRKCRKQHHASQRPTSSSSPTRPSASWAKSASCAASKRRSMRAGRSVSSSIA